MAGVVNVSDIIDRSPVSGLQKLVIALCALVQIVDGFDGQAMAYAAPPLIHAWGLKHEAMGPIFSASLTGIFFGTLILSPIADRIGRKSLMVLAMLCVSGATVYTAVASDSTGLLISRLITGLGLGASLPTTFVMASEYVPVRRRTSLVLFMACGFAIGGALGGQIAAALLDYFSWRSIFVVGGVLPLILAFALFFWLPESLKWLSGDPTKTNTLRNIVRRLAPASADATEFALPTRAEVARGSVRALFEGRLAIATPILWSLLFLNFLALNFLNSWLPSVMNLAGLSVKDAVRVTTFFQFGGLFGIATLGLLSDRFGPLRVLISIVGLSAIATAVIGSVERTPATLSLIVAAAGFCVVGAQNVLFAIAAAVYPTNTRSTGAGWAMGVGRLGSIAAPLIGGALLTIHFSITHLFFVAAVPSALEVFAGLGLLYVTSKMASFGDRPPAVSRDRVAMPQGGDAA